LYFFQGDDQSDFCATASRASAASLIPLNQIENSQYDFRLAVTRDVSDILFETDGITINVFMISVIAVLAILIIVFFVQQTIYRRLASAIHVLNELTHGNLDTDFKHKKSFFVNEDDEVGKLVSALKIYKTSLQELDDERKNRRLSRLERDKLIIEKMRTLSLQLEGDAQALLVRDIDQMQTMMDQVAGKHFQSGNSTDRQKIEEDSNRLISVAFERMSDQVTALIEARTAEMESARDEANEANTAKSKFLANMSHELRTPLNAIIGYGELLLEEAEEEGIESMSEDLKRITDSGTHLLNLINDILDISKIEAGRLELFISDFELANVINTLQSVAKPLGEKNNNQVIFERTQNLGSMHTDETRLRQSLLNLIGNACKFTENGVVKLTVTNSTNDINVLFAVSDTGIGLTDEQISKIFDDFTQAGSETAAKFGGTGLGLSITKNLIEMMGGTLSVKSEIGAGSVFTIEVPRNCEIALPSAALSNGNIEISGLIQEGSGPRILIIDDDPMTHDIIKRKLSDEEFSIFSAMDGTSGINAVRDFAPDVIFLDILMPGKDGWAVIAELKADELLSKIPVIVISMLDDDFSAKALGATAYMKKPIEKKVLLENIASIFSGETVGKKALIIDDHADAREIISRILSATGFEVETAVNGADGLDKLASGFDLVILDLSMPVMDGFQFLARLEEANLISPPQIIVYSAMHLDETMRASLSGQCKGIIDKNEIDAQASLKTIVKQALSS
jgi:signal transduction histidine kinase/CheY-like chemotaxis protein